MTLIAASAAVPQRRVFTRAGVDRHDFPGLQLVTNENGGMTSYYGGSGTVMWWGSYQELGLASIPVLRIGPWRGWSLDLYGGGKEYQRAWWRLGVGKTF